MRRPGVARRSGGGAVSRLRLWPVGLVRRPGRRKLGGNEPAKVGVRRRPVAVSGVEQSQARIIVFRALYQGKELGENESVPPESRITREWDLRNAERAEIEPGIGAVDPSKGMCDVFPRETTKFTLRVYDSRGVPTQKTITIKVEAPPSEVPPPP